MNIEMLKIYSCKTFYIKTRLTNIKPINLRTLS